MANWKSTDIKQNGDGSYRAEPSIDEDELQRRCVRWFRLVWPQYELRIFHPANGGSRHPIEAAKLKGMGVTPGVCDLIITIPRGKWHGLFIELKVGNNQPTTDQLKYIAEHRNDYSCHVCYTQNEFETIVNSYLKQPPTT